MANNEDAAPLVVVSTLDGLDGVWLAPNRAEAERKYRELVRERWDGAVNAEILPFEALEETVTDALGMCEWLYIETAEHLEERTT